MYKGIVEACVNDAPFTCPADSILAIESGECTGEEIIGHYQTLIDFDIVWGLQGSFGRTAARLLVAGLCQPTTPTARGVLRSEQN